jgi:hypothetical protein
METPHDYFGEGSEKQEQLRKVPQPFVNCGAVPKSDLNLCRFEVADFLE